MTGLDLISQAGRLIGVLASGETFSSTEANDGFNSLNLMLDSWSAPGERLMIYNLTENDFTLVPNQQKYQWGTGAPDINATRPTKIVNASLRQQYGVQNFDLPIAIIDNDQWNAILVKLTPSTIPLYLYPEYTYPYVTFQLWPYPSSANTLVLYSFQPLTQLASLTTTLSFPSGYAEMMLYNLACRMAPSYGRPLAAIPEVVQMAAQLKGKIKRSNSTTHLLACDEALLPVRAGFNWLTGGFK
jgi:hypothetical protein